MNRRDLLLGAGALGFAPQALAQTAASDPFGLRAILGSGDPYDSLPALERALAGFGEPSILRKSDVVKDATFRLTRVVHGWPSCARVEWDPVTLLASADVSAGDAGGRGPPTSYLLNMTTEEAVELRALADDRERFWDAAPRVPDWDAMDGLVITSHVAYLLEARVGDKRHAILRTHVPKRSLIQTLADELLPDSRPQLPPS